MAQGPVADPQRVGVLLRLLIAVGGADEADAGSRIVALHRQQARGFLLRKGRLKIKPSCLRGGVSIPSGGFNLGRV
jgi:hypothetical protein